MMGIEDGEKDWPHVTCFKLSKEVAFKSQVLSRGQTEITDRT